MEEWQHDCTCIQKADDDKPESQNGVPTGLKDSKKDTIRDVKWTCHQKTAALIAHIRDIYSQLGKFYDAFMTQARGDDNGVDDWIGLDILDQLYELIESTYEENEQLRQGARVNIQLADRMDWFFSTLWKDVLQKKLPHFADPTMSTRDSMDTLKKHIKNIKQQKDDMTQERDVARKERNVATQERDTILKENSSLSKSNARKG